MLNVLVVRRLWIPTNVNVKVIIRLIYNVFYVAESSCHYKSKSAINEHLLWINNFNIMNVQYMLVAVHRLKVT